MAPTTRVYIEVGNKRAFASAADWPGWSRSGKDEASALDNLAAYALRYAHLYYRDDEEGVGGLSLPGDAAPAYLDFAYFAFTIGMCFQVSDIAVSSPQIRRTVLGHSVLSFLYNTAILATAINLAVGTFN